MVPPPHSIYRKTVEKTCIFSNDRNILKTFFVLFFTTVVACPHKPTHTNGLMNKLCAVENNQPVDNLEVFCERISQNHAVNIVGNTLYGSWEKEEWH